MNERDQRLAVGGLLLPEGSRPARWIVCEREGTWAVRLRRTPGASALRIHETRSLADAWQMLAQAPASFLTLEATPRTAGPLAGRLLRLGRDFPLALATVVAPHELAAYEELMREAGAIMFTASPRHLAPLVDAARRHLAAAPASPSTWAEAIWAQLPWSVEREQS
jgi:hypothetical protein